VYDECEGVIRILGRTSVDIIKSAGYKISALEVEKHILSIPEVKEVTVVALPDEVYGEIVCAIVVPRDGFEVTLQDIHDGCKDEIAKYKLPKAIKIIKEIPRNAMGKVNKKELIAALF